MKRLFLKINFLSFIFLTISLMFLGCSPNFKTITLDQYLQNQKKTTVDHAPTTFEKTEDTDVEIKQPTPLTQKPNETVPPAEKPVTQPPEPVKIEASKFIQTAYDVMVKEGKSIGTPCNLYLQRVLLRAGFKVADFVANDFDLYAKKYFKSYKAEDFRIDSNRSDKDELKAYLWSHQERTPFILQWTRPGHFGHIAILERQGESLIIYQASLGRHTAQRDQTTIERLLSSKYRASLTVYSEFK